jgi:hypothetical protein
VNTLAASQLTAQSTDRFTIAAVLLLINVVFGTADTLWYHEFRAKLPFRLEVTRPELRLHAARDFVYLFVYGGLAIGAPSGVFACVACCLLGAEIVITLTDFVIEDRDRPSIGGIAPGERILHSLMAIVYGAAMVNLVPALWGTRHLPTGFATFHTVGGLRMCLAAAALGIALTGVRDAAALRGHIAFRRLLTSRVSNVQPCSDLR